MHCYGKHLEREKHAAGSGWTTDTFVPIEICNSPSHSFWAFSIASARSQEPIVWHEAFLSFSSFFKMCHCLQAGGELKT